MNLPVLMPVVIIVARLRFLHAFKGELRAIGLSDRLPPMAGVQPRHYNALEIARQRGLATEDELASLSFDNVPPTILVKLRHTILPDGAEALARLGLP